MRYVKTANILSFLLPNNHTVFWEKHQITTMWLFNWRFSTKLAISEKILDRNIGSHVWSIKVSHLWWLWVTLIIFIRQYKVVKIKARK